jgi:Lrp/AsnC family transcriptional regulator, leucine-responsive regulatory protein
MPNTDLEPLDLKILDALQRDGRLTNQALASEVALSASPCWRRVRQLEERGVIQGYQAVLDRREVGFGVLAFIRVKIDVHSEAEAEAFSQSVLRLKEVVACYSIAGDADFLLQVVSRDLDTYADFAMATIRRLPHIKEMQTSLVLKEIKPFRGLPVKEAGG